MKILTGTSGFAYKPWKGAFYPEDLKDADMLSYYAGRLGAVEINNTFYRLPKREVLEGWRDKTPDGFRFVLKASRRITHFTRLKPESLDPTTYFVETAGALGERLGALLFQLPPNFKKDMERLGAFLAAVPAGPRLAFEFRHDSWHDDDVFDLLREHGAALVWADDGEREVPLVRTTDWGYLRLRQETYDEDDLRTWKARAEDQGWAEALVFFKHEDAGAGPRLAARFLEV